eukprot:572480-Rhodomonas_salina.1
MGMASKETATMTKLLTSHQSSCHSDSDVRLLKLVRHSCIWLLPFLCTHPEGTGKVCSHVEHQIHLCHSRSSEILSARCNVQHFLVSYAVQRISKCSATNPAAFSIGFSVLQSLTLGVA